MKLVKVLDKEGNHLVSDPTNQIILRELVTSEHSVSELAAQLNLPILNLWRRMQKLQKAGLVELTKTVKAGNIEKKFYRSTATWFTPKEYFNFKPKDPNLQEAFAIYTEIQKMLVENMATYSEIPNDADPIDFSLFANMQAFAEVCCKPTTQAKIVRLQQELKEFSEQSDFFQKQS